jgi:hypothetical protein
VGASPLVVIVNASTAKHCWPGQSAIGKRMHVGNPRKGYPWGVVADTKLGARDEPSGDQWFAPVEQPATLLGLGGLASLAAAQGVSATDPLFGKVLSGNCSLWKHPLSPLSSRAQPRDLQFRG